MGLDLLGIIGISFLLGSMLLLAIIFISIRHSINQKQKLKVLADSTFDKYEIDLNFNFNCEYCYNVISTTEDNCPNCGGNYHLNKEYKQKKYKKNQEYLQF